MSARRIIRQFRVACDARDAHALWRNHERLASDFGRPLIAQQHGARTRWICSVPWSPAELTWDTHITADVPGRLLTWSTSPDEPFGQSWDLWFAERADGRGTDVRLVIELVAPGTNGAMDESRNSSLDGRVHGTEDPLFETDPEEILDHLIQRWQRQLSAAH